MRLFTNTWAYDITDLKISEEGELSFHLADFYPSVEKTDSKTYKEIRDYFLHEGFVFLYALTDGSKYYGISNLEEEEYGDDVAEVDMIALYKTKDYREYIITPVEPINYITLEE